MPWAWRRAGAVPWPWRHGGARRRAGPRGDHLAAAGVGGGALPGHRAGRDDPLQVRPAGYRRTESQPLPGRCPRSHVAATCGASAGLARSDGPAGGGQPGEVSQRGARPSGLRRLLPPGHARTGTGPSAAGQSTGPSWRRRHRKPAGDSLDLRLDPVAPDAARLARLGNRAGTGAGKRGGSAAGGDARALAVLPHPHRHAGNGAGQG
ncbi:hypothetical protein D9M68_804410 [compost metagenome]